MSGSLTRLVAGLMAVLVVVLALEWLLPGDSVLALPAVRLAGPARQVAPPARRTGAWADMVLARPVFSISRRPPRVAAGPKADTEAGQARLAGIMVSSLRRLAIFAPDGGGKPLVLAEGASVNDSTIKDILPDRVILASGAVLTPAYDHNRVVPPPAAPFFQPPFQNPAFPNPGFPAPGGPPIFNPAQPNPVGENGQPAGSQMPGVPPFRGPMIVPRRD
jgi:hypothetical protein